MLYAFEMYCLIVWFGLALSLDIQFDHLHILNHTKKTREKNYLKFLEPNMIIEGDVVVVVYF